MNGMRFAYMLRMRFAAFFILSSIVVCAAADNVTGRWEGSIKIPGQEFTLIVDLDQSEGKNWTGSLIIPGLGVKGAPLTEVTVNDSGISFTIKGALASARSGTAKFQGHLAGAGQLTGDFQQAGNTAPFMLQKTGPPEVELPRQSTLISQNLEGEWRGDYEMNGYPRHVTLTLSNHQSGGATAQLVVAGKRTTKAPVDFVAEENGFLTIESHEIGVTYEGRLLAKTGELKGTFTLGPFERPLVLRRTP
jgi:hypothetical protein